jgi:hypothetical protein
MEQIMTITMSHKDLEISETNSKSPIVSDLIAQINEASQTKSITANHIVPTKQNLFTSEDLQISATPVKSTNPVVQQEYAQLMDNIAIATSPRELQNVAEIPATDNVVSQTSGQNIQNAVKNLNLSWVDRVTDIKNNGIGSGKSSGFGLGV